MTKVRMSNINTLEGQNEKGNSPFWHEDYAVVDNFINQNTENIHRGILADADSSKARILGQKACNHLKGRGPSTRE